MSKMTNVDIKGNIIYYEGNCESEENSKISERCENKNTISLNKAQRKKRKKCVDFIDYIKQKGIVFDIHYESDETRQNAFTPSTPQKKEQGDSKTQEGTPSKSSQNNDNDINKSISINEKSPFIKKRDLPNSKYIYNYNYNYNYLTYNREEANSLYANYLHQLNIRNYIFLKQKQRNMLCNIFLQYQNEQLRMYYATYHSKMFHNCSKDQEEPEKPFFFHNYKEEVETVYVLCIIEALFTFDNLDQDFFLRNMLNEDGFVSVEVLARHPQMKIFGVNDEMMRKVLCEHRQNEITETVETFDTINIRNRDWIEINEQLVSLEKVFVSTMVKMELFTKKLYQNCFRFYYFDLRNYANGGKIVAL